MGVKPSVSGKPHVAAPQAAAPQPGVPRKPGLALKSRAPRIGASGRKINESTIITVVIILIFLLIGGLSYKYLGENSAAGEGAANAAGINNSVPLNAQNGPGTLAGTANEGLASSDKVGVTGDSSMTLHGNVNGRVVYEASGTVGGPTGANAQYQAGGANGAGNAKGVQGFITGDSVSTNGKTGFNRGYTLGGTMNGNANAASAGNGGSGSGGQAPNPNVHRPGFSSW